jgi:pimeloyl-ACP methyl ester carboxylesterase
MLVLVHGNPETVAIWMPLVEALGAPVDIVGHDWGGIHVLAVAMTRPELLRSWSTDAIAVFDPSFAWHALARRWETPGVGEREIAALTTGSEASRAAYLRSIGIPPAVADTLAPGTAEVDPRCILDAVASLEGLGPGGCSRTRNWRRERSTASGPRRAADPPRRRPDRKIGWL